MQSVHNPDRFIADLRQILSQGRKRIGLLVGAGAPMSIMIDPDGNLSETGSPLIPSVDALTKLVCDGLEDEIHKSAVLSLAQQIGEKANIEQILSQVRLMQRAIGKVKVQGLDAEGYGNLCQRICDQIGKVVAVKLPKHCG